MGTRLRGAAPAPSLLRPAGLCEAMAGADSQVGPAAPAGRARAPALLLPAGWGVSCGAATPSSLSDSESGQRGRGDSAGSERALGLSPPRTRGLPSRGGAGSEGGGIYLKGKEQGAGLAFPGAKGSGLFPGAWGWGAGVLKRRRCERLLESEEMVLALLR